MLVGRRRSPKDAIIDAADKLFSERGYAAVTLRDIASEVKLKHASLYHHFPGGKEELFVRVTEKSLAGHRQGLEGAIAACGQDLRKALYAVADWLLGHAPMDLIRMVHSDMPRLTEPHAKALSDLAFVSLILPVARVITDARNRGEVATENPILVAGGLLGMIESLHAAPQTNMPAGLDEMAQTLVDTMLEGLLVRRSNAR